MGFLGRCLSNSVVIKSKPGDLFLGVFLRKDSTFPGEKALGGRHIEMEEFRWVSTIYIIYENNTNFVKIKFPSGTSVLET